MSDRYIQLLQQFPPRTINNEEELEATQVVIDKLLDRAELSQDESDYLNLLGTLVFDYEQKGEPIPDIYGVELLKQSISGNGTNDIDVSSQFGSSGQINLTIFTPLEAAQRLPEQTSIVAEQNIVQVCQRDRVAAAQNSFSIEGRGGIIPEPGLPLNSNNIYVDSESDSTSSIPAPIETADGKIQLARGVKVSKDGTITLTAYRTDNAGQRIPPAQQSCS